MSQDDPSILPFSQAKSASAGPAGAFSTAKSQTEGHRGESCSSPVLGAANDPAHVSSQLKSEYFWFPVSSCRPDLQESPRAVGALHSPQENIRTALFLQELIHPGPWQAEFCTAQCSCCTCRQDPGLHTAILVTQHKNFYWKDSFFLTLVIRLGQMNFINKEQMYYVPHVS